MTSQLFKQGRSDFSDEALLDELPLGSHDAVIVGDTITTLHLNSEWRKFVSSAIGSYFSSATRKASQAQLDDFDPLLSILLDDFYSAEGTAMTTIVKSALRVADYEFASGVNILPFDTGDYDVSNPTRILIPDTGAYVVTANFWETNFGMSTPFIRMWILKNGTQRLAFEDGTGEGIQLVSAAWAGQLTIGDYLELVIFAENANVRFDLSFPPELSLIGHLP